MKTYVLLSSLVFMGGCSTLAAAQSSDPSIPGQAIEATQTTLHNHLDCGNYNVFSILTETGWGALQGAISGSILGSPGIGTAAGAISGAGETALRVGACNASHS